MTLIFTPSGDIQSGLLIGDDDNAETVLKGLVLDSVTTAPGVYSFSYDISSVAVSSFHKVSALDWYSDATWVQTRSPFDSGTAREIGSALWSAS
jgi:hypothetical protein